MTKKLLIKNMPCYLNLKNCITTLRVVFLRELLSNLDLRVKF
jgi:hypothetical protein